MKRILIAFLFSPIILSSQINKNYLLMLNKEKITLEEASILIKNKSNGAKKTHKTAVNELEAIEVYQLKKNNDLLVAFYDHCAYKIEFDDYFNYTISKYPDFYSTFNGKGFLDNINNYIDAFFEIFGRDNLDYSINSLKYLERKIREKQGEGIADEQMFFPIVAYIGQTLIKETNGNWEVAKNALNNDIVVIKSRIKSYDPYICVGSLLSKGIKKYQLWAAIYNQLTL